MITAISPIDGRYSDKTKSLNAYYSEFALFKYRVKIEIEYLIALSEIESLQSILKLTADEKISLRHIYENFSIEDANQIKQIETVTKHDIKAVEYFLKEKLSAFGKNEIVEWVHFGLTSQDINNTAIPLLMKDSTLQIILPKLEKLQQSIKELANKNKHLSMLSRTHGQAASPSTLGKEIAVFHERISIQIQKLANYEYSGKFGGATGNFNAHKIALPAIHWPKWADFFLLEKLTIKRQNLTTQIAHYDEIAEWCQCYSRINTILIDFCRDIWQYISLEYFNQKVIAGEVGSSAMPHKVNPIDFENAEGNLSYANSIFEFFASKLPISRLQRDLTDSTVLRNLGVPIAHSLIAIESLEKGLSKLIVNHDKINQDLDSNFLVIAEAIQTILRREKYPKPYEALKLLTRGNQKLTKSTVEDFLSNLTLEDHVKQELLELLPQNYIGYASEFEI
ncbi:MAG: adenylosuccinate lyase [Saprospiraceae bacterium]|nr:adenylosuccinate lyase [Saprospiraceae bacterium]